MGLILTLLGGSATISWRFGGGRLSHARAPQVKGVDRSKKPLYTVVIV